MRQGFAGQFVRAILFTAVFAGCNVTESDSKKPPETPDGPVETVGSLESFGKAFAVRNDRHLIGSPRELATLVNQLVRSGDLSQDDAKAIEKAFPGMKSDNRAMTKADSDTLRGLK